MARKLSIGISLLLLSCATVAMASPLSLGVLSLSNVGPGHLDPLDDELEFRLTNSNGTLFGDFSAPITFGNATLTIDWMDPGAPYAATPPGIVGALDWYLEDDEDRDSPILSRNLVPSTSPYVSSRFTRRYGISKAVLTMELAPAAGWTIQGGGIYSPPSATFELVFWPGEIPPSDLLVAVDAPSSWDLLLPNDVPEPSTYFTGGLGALVMLIGRRYMRRA